MTKHSKHRRTQILVIRTVLSITNFHLMVQYIERAVVGCRALCLVSNYPPLMIEVELR